MTITTHPQTQSPTRRHRGLSAQRRCHRPRVNIAPAERAGRILIGLAAIIAGAVLLASATSGLAVTLEVLLVATGLDMAVTGTLGHCPLYAKLGHVPASLARRS